MAIKSSAPLNLLLCMIICLSFLTQIQADENQRQAYIVYMGNRANPDIPVIDIYLKMIAGVLGSIPNFAKASEYLMHTYENFQGFVAYLTEQEAEKFSRMQGVVSLFPNEMMHLETTRSWDFMGMHLDVKRSSTESDVIVGVIDSGIWPESDSFSDEGFSPPPNKWKGQCHRSLNFTCNNKVIGARYFRIDGNIRKAGIVSPRDSDGHGTHTASTVAGGVVDRASFLGLGDGSARGGVPSARIAVYKVCWLDGCFSADILAAFDAAISDGVDILSVSVGGKTVRPYFRDPYAIGAFHAMRRGILTSTAAGNEGPFLHTTTKGAPWYLSVAASTIDRKFTTTVQLGNGLVVKGISLNTFDLQNKTFPLIYGGDAENSLSTSAYPSRTCLEDSLNSSLVKGKIVLCDVPSNGEGAFLAGAAGVIMQGLDNHDTARIFPLPTSYLLVDDATSVLSYARNLTSTPYGTILKSVAINDTSAPVVATFSSRGPNPNSPGILMPDLTAPGVDILAAYSPIAPVTAVEGDSRSVTYSILSGTSMACPHATAAAAYVKSFHPTWSPAAIKSALMTSALPMSSAVNEEAEFAYGSGHINPLKAVEPGLIYDAGEDDYIDFLCSEGLDEIDIKVITGKNNSCKISNWDLNYPSIALPTTAGAFDSVFKRTVTNVGSPNSNYSSVVTTPEGQAVAIKVQPDVLSFDSLGQQLSFTVRVSGSIGLRALISGSLVWDDGVHEVRSPIIVYNLS